MPVHQTPVWAHLFRWLGALLFLGSLGYFLLSYLRTFGAPITSGTATPAVMWNVTLFTVFAFHHSVCARWPVRRWFALLVPTSLERSTYVWIASLLLIVVCALWRPVPGVAWDADEILHWPFRLIQIGGVWLTLRSAMILDVRELAGISDTNDPWCPTPTETSTRISTVVQPHDIEFTTTGPYGWIRHPIYAGWFLLVFAVMPMTMTRLTFAVISCAYLLIAIPLEERSIQATSGPAYGRYKALVRWRLLPGVY